VIEIARAKVAGALIFNNAKNNTTKLYVKIRSKQQFCVFFSHLEIVKGMYDINDDLYFFSAIL